MKFFDVAAPLLAVCALANASAIPGFSKREAGPLAQQPPGPGQCQDVTCYNDQVCAGIGCGACLQSSGGGVCLDPPSVAAPVGTSKRDAAPKPEPEAAPEAEPQAPQPPGPGQCQDVTCYNDQVCAGIGCGACLQSSGGGVCLDPATSKRDVEAIVRRALEQPEAIFRR